MSLKEDLKAFLNVHDKISQTKQNLQNDIKLPEFDVREALAQTAANAIIATVSNVFSSSDLLSLKGKMNAALADTINTSQVGANHFFDNIKDATNMNFLFNPEGVFDLIRPLANDLGFAVSQGVSDVDKFKDMLSDFNTFIQATPRARLDTVSSTLLGTQKVELQKILAKIKSINVTFDTKGVVIESDRLDAINDLDVFFNSVTSADEVMPEVERRIRELQAQGELVKTSVQDCIDKKDQSETIVDNYVNDSNLQPYQKQTFATAEKVIEDLSGTVDAVIDNNTQFVRVNSQSKISQDLQTVRTLLNTLPSDLPGAVASAAHKPVYDTYKSNLAAVANTNMQDVVDGVDNVIQEAQTTVVRDINAAFNSTVGTFTALLGNASSDLGNISTAVGNYVPALTDIGKKMDKALVDSGMDRLANTLTQGSFFDYAGMIANDGTYAGKLAQTLAEEIAALPPEEGGKKIAYELARNTMVGVHQTQLITARAIQQEVAGNVSQLSKQDEEIKKATDLINQHLQ